MRVMFPARVRMGQPAPDVESAQTKAASPAADISAPTVPVEPPPPAPPVVAPAPTAPLRPAWPLSTVSVDKAGDAIATPNIPLRPAWPNQLPSPPQRPSVEVWARKKPDPPQPENPIPLDAKTNDAIDDVTADPLDKTTPVQEKIAVVTSDGGATVVTTNPNTSGPSGCGDSGYYIPGDPPAGFGKTPLPKVPPGYPCLVTIQQAADGDPRTNQLPWEPVFHGYLSRVLAEKNWPLYRLLKDKPSIMRAIVNEMSAGVWNLVVPFHGTTPTWPRPSQAYGLGAISERWLSGLYNMSGFTLGTVAHELPYAQPNPMKYYATASCQTIDPQSAIWLIAYAGTMSAQLGLELQLGTSGAPPKPSASADVKKAAAIVAKVSSANAQAIWLRAWWRRGSVSGAAQAILNSEFSLSNFVRAL